MDSVAPMVLGVVLLVGLIGVGLSHTTWRWFNILPALLLLLSAPVCFVITARCVRTLENWQKETVAYKARVAEVDQAIIDAQKGVVKDNVVVMRGLRQAELELARNTYREGRMWLGVQGTSRGVSAGMLTVPLGSPVNVNTTLYVFDSKKATDGGTFLGEFTVTKVDAAGVQLDLRWPKETKLTDKIRESSLQDVYEAMPYDDHWVFASSDENELGKYFPATVGTGEKAASIDLKEYLNDGKPVADNLPDGPGIWTKVQFERDQTVVDYAFKPGDIATFDAKSAEELISAGTAKKIGRQYVRPLRQYADAFRDQLQQQAVLKFHRDEIEGAAGRIAQAVTAVNDQIALRKDEQAKLAADLTQFKADAAALDSALAKLETHLKQKQDEGRALFADIRRLSAELKDAQFRLIPTPQIESPSDRPAPVKPGAGDRQARLN